MLLLQTQKSYVVHYKFWRHILDWDASGFHGAYKLINIHPLVTFLKIFLHVLISEASKYNMCKFYQIASNCLQVIHIVHELFDYPSYNADFFRKQFMFVLNNDMSGCLLQIHFYGLPYILVKFLYWSSLNIVSVVGIHVVLLCTLLKCWFFFV